MSDYEHRDRPTLLEASATYNARLLPNERDGMPSETRASDHVEHCPRCNVDELDPWAVHIAHDQDCEGSGWCCCDEVCEACCSDCNPPEAL